VSGDTELISAPAYYLAAKRAPSINAFMTGIAIIQDELAHAHIAYHILEDSAKTRRSSSSAATPRASLPLRLRRSADSWTELVVANGMYDQAGSASSATSTTSAHTDLEARTKQVMAEENFHLRNGRTWMKRISAAGGSAKDELQRAVDWMFPLSVEWFGLPDSMKMHSTQLEYRLKGLTNDQLRQWCSRPSCLLRADRRQGPAHKEVRDGKDVWELDYPFPCEFDAEEKRWISSSRARGTACSPVAVARASQRRDGGHVPGGVPQVPQDTPQERVMT